MSYSSTVIVAASIVNCALIYTLNISTNSQRHQRLVVVGEKYSNIARVSISLAWKMLTYNYKLKINYNKKDLGKKSFKIK